MPGVLGRPIVEVLGDPALEATFVAGAHGRDGRLVVWRADGAATEGLPDEHVLVRPVDGAVAPVSTAARFVSIAEAVEAVGLLPADHAVSDSVRAWARATTVAVDLVARGRLQPSIGRDGIDTWRVGPLDNADHQRVAQLVAALPAAAHAAPVGDPAIDEPTITSPFLATYDFLDAVADVLVRTAAGSIAAEAEAFAAPDVEVDVSEWAAWLELTTSGRAADAGTVLRVDLPEDPDDPVEVVLQLQSRIDPGLVLDAVDLWDADPAVRSRFGDEVDLELLVTLRRAAQVWPPLDRLLASTTPDRLVIDDAAVEDLFGPIADDLAAAGLPVLWPVEVFRPVELRAAVTTDDAQDRDTRRPGTLDLASLGELRWLATIDGEDLTEAELEALAEAKRPMVRMRGRWVRADPTRLRTLADRRPVQAGDAIAAALTGTLTVDGEVVEAEISPALQELADRLRTVDPDAEVPTPGLVAHLRPYQRRGVTWLAHMAELAVGGVLADDMGLGKTVQMLAVHAARRGSGPMLVVCPATLLSNWEREAARFVPDIPVRRYHGANRSLDGLTDDEIVVTTYGIVRRDAEVLDAVDVGDGRGWDLVVADEAQAVKNPRSGGARALRDISAHARFALTGTPVENRLTDLWAILDWTTPGLLGRLETFTRTLATPIERDRDPEATERLAAVVRPFVLRRRKTDPDIAPDLPPKTETDRYVGITTEQSTLYRAVVAELLTDVHDAEGITRRGLVLKLLTALKQICNHPAQYLGQSLDDAPLRGRSGKLDAASDLVNVIADEGESVLVFTQYVAMGNLLLHHFRSQGLSSQFLHGSVPIPERQRMVDSFQDGDPQVFVVSLKAGGTGLNLTQATHVIHYDRWWNPAVEDQASDRAWRIGQDRPVQVHRLICEGTLEDRIAALLESKRALADAVVGSGEAWLSELTDDELAELVALGGDA